ncbi:MAG: hypothetical protein CSH49_18330 [Alcanivorax sp.]|nr:MAG: hypothetical protein CSH49_18330 [Alcanivorax sp.]
MSVLYLDFGNSRFKWRLSDGGITAQSYEGFDAWLHSLSGHGDLTAVVFASVLTERRQEGITEQLKSALSLPLQRCVVTSSALGVQCAYRDLDRLGIDRWLAVVAAWAKYGEACAVVDAGTAATLDFVDVAGHHLGGYIVSGLTLALQGLLAGTDNIRPDPAGFESAALVPGVNTAEAIYHGALYSLVALIESSYQNLLKSFPQAKLILAGGDAALVGSHLYSQHELVEDLVFEGMQLLESAALLIDA